MMTSVESCPPYPEYSSLNRKKPQRILSLNVNAKNSDEKAVIVAKHSNSCYIIQNYPLLNDLTGSTASSSKYIFEKAFFNGKDETRIQQDLSLMGDDYCVVQKCNGKEMEDTYKVKTSTRNPDLSFFGVYDGHSTYVIAETLAQKLDEYLLTSIDNGNDITYAIKEAFKQVESEVIAILQDLKQRGGSTALCAVLYKGTLYCANLGDSRAVVFQENDFIGLSNLHDFYNESEVNFVSDKGGIILNNRLEGELAVSRSIGDIRFKPYMNCEPEIIKHEIKGDDEYLLLGTDGFWNGLCPSDTLKSIKALKEQTPTKNLLEMGESLIEECCQKIRTKKDNMTLIMVDIKQLLKK